MPSRVTSGEAPDFDEGFFGDHFEKNETGFLDELPRRRQREGRPGEDRSGGKSDSSAFLRCPMCSSERSATT
jgi:hypothetical protein